MEQMSIFQVDQDAPPDLWHERRYPCAQNRVPEPESLSHGQQPFLVHPEQNAVSAETAIHKNLCHHRLMSILVFSTFENPAGSISIYHQGELVTWLMLQKAWQLF